MRREEQGNRAGTNGSVNAFEAVKRAVPVARYVEELTELRRSGGVLVGRCPLPDHEDRTPSFTIWPEGGSAFNGTWWCFGCSRGSDVFDLYSYTEGCSEPWEALVGLSLKYGVELPEKPKRWREWSTEKGRRRGMLVDVIAASYRRRLFRFFKDDLEDIEDLEEREEEARELWEGLWKLSWLCASWRVNG